MPNVFILTENNGTRSLHTDLVSSKVHDLPTNESWESAYYSGTKFYGFTKLANSNSEYVYTHNGSDHIRGVVPKRSKSCFIVTTDSNLVAMSFDGVNFFGVAR